MKNLNLETQITGGKVEDLRKELEEAVKKLTSEITGKLKDMETIRESVTQLNNEYSKKVTALNEEYSEKLKEVNSEYSNKIKEAIGDVIDGNTSTEEKTAEVIEDHYEGNTEEVLEEPEAEEEFETEIF